MGATPEQYVRFKRVAATYARSAGHLGATPLVLIASQRITNSEGFTGESLVEPGSTVYDRQGNAATLRRVLHRETLVVDFPSGGDKDVHVPAREFGVVITEH